MKKIAPLTVILLLACLLSSVFSAWAENPRWPGVDEAVVEKFAKEHGREAAAPLIDKDQGDLLLFLFLLAGAAGGFAAGYCWRMLLTEKRGEKPVKKKAAAGPAAGCASSWEDRGGK